jgi:uncharacterized protein (DUF305 family)
MALLLAGCGAAQPGGTRTAEPPPVNQADADFAVNMSQHDAQALDMAALAEDRARSNRVKAIATEIEKARAARIDVYATWLNAWVPVRATMPPHGLDGHVTPGMTKPQDIAALESVSGGAFDRKFLALMIRHDRAGLKLARSELNQGTNPEATRLAQDLQDAQTMQITQMQRVREALE